MYDLSWWHFGKNLGYILLYYLLGFSKVRSINKKMTFHPILKGAKLMHFPKLLSAIGHVRSMLKIWNVFGLQSVRVLKSVCSINKKTKLHRRLKGAKLMHFPKLLSAIGHVPSMFDLSWWHFGKLGMYFALLSLRFLTSV